ncbi:MAG: hypothetical protein AMK73_02915 [Planctomycetes bacterium SM23_32]|nr:MAG: hypothetical protein AMK73_02915 [Planctomycetes bacterium SM23_32]
MRRPAPSPRRARAARLAALACALLPLVAASAAGAQGGTFRHETEHYRIETDISAQFTRLVGMHMEEIFKEYSRRFAEYGEVRQRFNVAVFSTEEGYLSEVPPQVRGSTGVFIASKQLLAAHAEDRTPEEVLRTLYHEGFHQFMFEVVSREAPIWLNEGLAEYFSEATWNGREFELGQVPTTRLHTVQQALRDGSYVRIGQLLTLNPDQWLQNVRTDAHRASLHYSESWSVVHFLIHGDNGRNASLLNDYLREIARSKPPERAFADVFKVDAGTFERLWGAYVMSLEPSPKFRCRDNMEALMLLAEMVYESPTEFEKVSDLRRKVLYTSGYHWEITRPTGQKVSSQDRQQAEALFRCPFDEGRSSVSYVVVRHVPTGMPILICDHHPGVVLKAYYRNDSPGRRRIIVEEEVRETLDPNLAQAIMAAVADR